MPTNTPTGIQYPCLFPIKIMGIKTKQLVAECITIIQNHCTHFNPEHDILIKHSRLGNYISITATVFAESKDQLDNLYQALNSHEHIKVII